MAKTSGDPAGSYGVGVTLQSVPKLRQRARPGKLASVLPLKRGYKLWVKPLPLGQCLRRFASADDQQAPVQHLRHDTSVLEGNLGGTPEGQYKSAYVLFLITILQVRYFCVLSEMQGV